MVTSYEEQVFRKLADILSTSGWTLITAPELEDAEIVKRNKFPAVTFGRLLYGADVPEHESLVFQDATIPIRYIVQDYAKPAEARANCFDGIQAVKNLILATAPTYQSLNLPGVVKPKSLRFGPTSIEHNAPLAWARFNLSLTLLYPWGNRG